MVQWHGGQGRKVNRMVCDDAFELLSTSSPFLLPIPPPHPSSPFLLPIPPLHALDDFTVVIVIVAVVGGVAFLLLILLS